MRILLLSDVHGNLQALEACLAAAPEHDLIVDLGDEVGYGANPNEVIQVLRSRGKAFVRGNHDKAVSGIDDASNFNPMAAASVVWTRGQMNAENMAWIKALPAGPVNIPEIPEVQFVHGSPRDEDEYVLDQNDAREVFGGISASITFFGHTHRQGGFVGNSNAVLPCDLRYKTFTESEQLPFPLTQGPKYLVNPGSVGQPRDGDWRAAFAMFETDTRTVTFCRVPYDVKTAQRKILEAHLPPRLAQRLSEGR